MLLAQALTDQPKMANHARGLWGYHGRTADGRELNVQATGIGGPSAIAVLADLAGLGVARAIRVGACVALDPGLELGQLVLAGHEETARGIDPGARRVTTGTASTLPGDPLPEGVEAFDTQTVALIEVAPALEVTFAVALIVGRDASGATLDDEDLDRACSAAAVAAERVL